MRRTRFLAVALVLLLGALTVVSAPSPALAADTTTITGTVAGGSGGTVTVRLQNTARVNVASAVPDPTTGAFTIVASPGFYRVLFDYEGPENILDSFYQRTYSRDGTSGVFSFAAGTTALSAYTLPTGGTISGTVTGAGTPTGAATITVGAGLLGGTPLNTPRVTVDQSTGDYVVDRVQPSTHNVLLCAGGQWRCKSVPNVVVGEGGVVTSVDGDLEAVNGIGGQALLTTGGAAIGLDVYLFAGEQYEVSSRQVRVDSTGTYFFAELPPGLYTVCFGRSPVDFSSRFYYYVVQCWGGNESPTPISVGTEFVEGIDAVVERASNITGTVRWQPEPSNPSAPMPAPQVLQNAEITLISLDPQPEFFTDRVQSTLSDGSFTFTSVQPGRYILRARYLNSDPYTPPTPWVNTLYSRDAWIIQDSTVITVVGDVDQNLGTMDLPERQIAVARLSGTNRYSTAVAISRTQFPGPNPVVPVLYIVNGQNYPDALSAGPAAAHQGGGLLTVSPTGIQSDTWDEIVRLDPQRIVVAGSETSVSASVFSQLEALVGTHNIQRLGGASRYETSRLIVEDAFDSATVVFIATGRNYPDALSAGPAAAKVDAPVLLVDGLAGGLDNPTIETLAALGATTPYVVGGLPSVGQAVLDDLSTVVGPGLVFAGANRYDTSAQVNYVIFETGNVWGDDIDMAFVATGTNFADALAGGALAGQWGAPLYLTPRECLAGDVIDAMVVKRSNALFLLGGVPSLSENVASLAFC